MTPPNKFTKKQEAKILEVGRRIREAREAQRLSIRGAAERTRTKRGSLTEATWRRAELGGERTREGLFIRRPDPGTLVAIAEVLGLDGDAMCRELEMTPPPAPAPVKPSNELAEIRRAVEEILHRLDDFEKR